MGNQKLVWERALSILEREIPAVSFETWIKDIVPVTEAGDALYFEVANDVHKNITNVRYHDVIRDAIATAVAELNLQASYDEPNPIFLTSSEVADLDLTAKIPDLTGAAQFSPMFNPAYTFSSFVVGNSNRFAHAACLGIAELPGHTYNPLFLYGGSGLGKTHLMQAIGNHIAAENPSANIIYVASETFTNELIASLASNSAQVKEQFRRKYRGADVLLIDDIQFIADKMGVQEELFHTFNALKETGRQIVFSSDKPPKEIPKIEERLRSRFEGGLVADIQPPDFETKVAILIKKAGELSARDGLSMEIPTDVYYFIAQKSTSNIRQLEGSLQRVIAASRLNGSEITIDLAEQSLKEYFVDNKQKRISARFITDVVCEYYEVSRDDICGTKKNREISYPRQIAMFLIRTMTDTSLKQIGATFGNKDHTTVMHACRKIEQDIQDDPDIAKVIEDLRVRIRD